MELLIQDKGDGAYRLVYSNKDGPALDMILDTEGVVRQVAACLGARVEIHELRVQRHIQSPAERMRLIAERNADGRHPIG